MLIIPLSNRNEWEHRFWCRVDKTDYCWVWTGTQTFGQVRSKNPNSREVVNPYGVISIKTDKKRTYKAHRVGYALMKGQIPSEKVLDHLCRNTLCVRPDHLDPVVQAENVRRGVGHSQLTHCINGHEYTKETLYIYYSDKYPNGRRGCRICIKKQSRKSYLKNKVYFAERKDKINARRREVARLKREGKWNNNTPPAPS